MGAVREIVVYLPAGGHRATANIARGSAIVGQPEPGSEEVTIYFEGATFENVRSLADRATQAAGRMVEQYATSAVRTVPREALTVVGTFNLREGRILLAGPHSKRAVAEWLGALRLDPAELRPSPQAGGGRSVPVRAAMHFAVASIEPELLRALMKRGGVSPDGAEWLAGDGRRTAVVGDAFLWALESIAAERR